jgi:serpin B
VLDGPVAASGYTWYKVAPVSFAELAGPGYGWVAAAGKDGTAWIAPAQGPVADASLAMAVVPRASGTHADAARAAASINALGVNLYRRLLTDKTLDLGNKNLVFSPTSIELALAMARAGAKGETAAQMDKVLQTKGWAELGSGVNALDQALASRNGKWTDGYGPKELTLRLANAPFAQRGWTIEPAYLDALGSTFGAGLRLVDYQADPDAARNTINGWVRDRTAGRIPELLGVPDVTSGSRLTLVNAIYLKAQWAETFQELTQPAPFRRPDGTKVSVPMMHRSGGITLPYTRGAGWQATELRYLGADEKHQLAMMLVLPDDLAKFQASLTADQLERITEAVTKERALHSQPIKCPGEPLDEGPGCFAYNLELFMPRFGIETKAKLKDVLSALGMPLALEPSADFSGIHTGDPLYIGSVIHQANIDVDEKGTTAAAATAVGMDTGGGPSFIKDITLRLDHPFLFFVRDVDTGAVLFMGRVTDPSAAKGS